jgi:transcriptional regulator with XRE-family HTH domain
MNGEKIKEIRQKLDISQEKLGEMIGGHKHQCRNSAKNQKTNKIKNITNNLSTK